MSPAIATWAELGEVGKGGGRRGRRAMMSFRRMPTTGELWPVAMEISHIEHDGENSRLVIYTDLV